MDIVSTIVEAIQSILTGSAVALSDGVESLLFEVSETGERSLSTAGTVIFTLFGLGCGIGLMYVLLRIFTRR